MIFTPEFSENKSVFAVAASEQERAVTLQAVVKTNAPLFHADFSENSGVFPASIESEDKSACEADFGSLQYALPDGGGLPDTGAVLYIKQTLTRDQKAQARENIGLAGTDETLSLGDDGILRVNTASDANQDNTLPITSAAVDTIVGNIEVLLKLI